MTSPCRKGTPLEVNRLEPKRPAVELPQNTAIVSSRERHASNIDDSAAKHSNNVDEERSVRIPQERGHSNASHVNTGKESATSINQESSKDTFKVSCRVNRPQENKEQHKTAKDNRGVEKEGPRSRDRSHHERDAKVKERSAQEGKDVKMKDRRDSSSQGGHESRSLRHSRDGPEDDPSQDEVRKMASLYTDELLDSDRSSKHKRNTKRLVTSARCNWLVIQHRYGLFFSNS